MPMIKHKLTKKTLKTLRKKGNAVHKKYASQINEVYPTDNYKPKNYLKEVQKYMGYK